MSDVVNARRIAQLNDAFRSNPTNGAGRFVMTRSVIDLPSEIVACAVAVMTNFKDFTEDNDPYGEHDFGAFDIQGHKFFWKIDYYDETCTYGSENPADEEKTTRHLVLMLSSDY